MTTFINDNGEELQYDGKDFAITKQTISFRDFKIKGDYSVNIKIPNNAHNRQILGYYGLNQLDSGAYSEHFFNLYRNGNKILRGRFYIQTDTKDELECFFISGNSNWIQKFQFNCKDVRNEIYSINWDERISSSVVDNNRNNIHGIVFPVIDYYGEGFSGEDTYRIGIQSDIGDSDFWPTNRFPVIYPCLYLHTLVEELSKISGVNIAGDILSDAVYQSLIITPSGPELTDPATNTRIYKNDNVSVSTLNHLITIGAIAPNIKAIEIIRYLCFAFGAIPEYDADSNTLTINKSKSVQLNSSNDWSAYIKSYNIEYDKVKQKVAIEYSQPSDLDYYNKSNEQTYGSLLINTGKEGDGKVDTIYKAPFLSSYHGLNRQHLAMLSVPFVKFYDIDLEGVYTYSSVTATSTDIRFNGTFPAYNQTDNIVIKIRDNNNLYSGFYGSSVSINTTNVTINLASASNNYFRATSTGSIEIYKLSTTNEGHRILRCKTGVSVSAFSNFTNIEFSSNITKQTTCSIAWFSKYKGYPTLNDETSINFGDINLTNFEDVHLGETTLQRLIGMLKNPPIKTKMLLPESIFQNHSFLMFPYIKSKEFNGYFYIYKIENYVDSNTECTVEMVQIA